MSTLTTNQVYILLKTCGKLVLTLYAISDKLILWHGNFDTEILLSKLIIRLKRS